MNGCLMFTTTTATKLKTQRNGLMIVTEIVDSYIARNNSTTKDSNQAEEEES